MMSYSEMKEIWDAGNELNDGLTIASERFDRIESDGVNLQCVNSSDFMVGKQTNFNGPVTIINYAEGEEPENRFSRDAGATEIVIKDRIMAPGITSSIEDFAKKKAEEEFKTFQLSNSKKDHQSCPQRVCKRTFLKIPVFVWSILLFSVTAGFITLGIELSAEVPEHENRTYLEVNGEKYDLIGRDEWEARPPLSVTPVDKKLPYVVISHSASQACYIDSTCREIIRNMQTWNMGDVCRFPDIKYNFLVGGNGYIYVGRGWQVRNENGNKVSNLNVDFSFVGNFEAESPSPSQVNAVAALVKYALANGYIANNYTIIPAKIVNGSASPGRYVLEKIRNWTNYRESFNS